MITCIENGCGARNVAIGDKGRGRGGPRDAVVVVLFVNSKV